MIALADRFTRRTRRRLIVISTAAVMGFALPIWVPRLLATLPAFHVSEVYVSCHTCKFALNQRCMSELACSC